MRSSPTNRQRKGSWDEREHHPRGQDGARHQQGQVCDQPAWGELADEKGYRGSEWRRTSWFTRQGACWADGLWMSPRVCGELVEQGVLSTGEGISAISLDVEGGWIGPKTCPG